MFVESYGRVAVQDSSFSPRIDAVLDRGTAQLRAAGFSSRSAFLTSPTFGGLSWLAHSTLQSGVRVDGQRRYDQLVKANRLTLTRAFKRAGWRAVGVMPANHRAWPEGSSFYHYDADLRPPQPRLPRPGLRPAADARPVHVPGPAAPRARQASPAAAVRRGRPHLEPRAVDADPPARSPGTTSATARSSTASRRRSPRRPRSSATPAGPRRLRAVDRVLAEHALLVRAALRRRRHSCSSSWATISPRRSSPARAPSHDVPISVIAHDPKVMDQIAGWGWQDGMLPSPQAPVWPMAAFRDRFLTAFGSRHEAGRPRAVRPGAAPRARVGVRPRRVRRAGELHDRRRDPGPGGAGRHRPRGRGAGPVLRRRRARALPHAGAGLRLPGRGRQRERRRHRPRAGGRACRAASRSRRSRPSRPAPSTSCSCSRRCSPSRTRTRWCARSPRRSGPAGASPSRSRRGRRSRRPSGRRCPTPTRSGSPRSTSWPRPWSGPGSPSRGRRTTAARTARRRRRWRARSPRTPRHIAAQIGRRALDELLAAHRLWIDWLDEGRVRKLALVAERAHD